MKLDAEKFSYVKIYYLWTNSVLGYALLYSAYVTGLIINEALNCVIIFHITHAVENHLHYFEMK